MRPLTFTIYEGAKVNQGTAYTLPWFAEGELSWTSLLLERDVRPNKDGNAVVLAHIDGTRAKVNVLDVHGIGLDIEKVNDSAVATALSVLDQFEYVWWTTHSHDPLGLRLRFILPFARTVDPANYPAVWSAVSAMIGGITDPATKDSCRLMYLPSVPESKISFAQSGRNHGEWLDPALLSVAPTTQVNIGSENSTKRLAIKVQARYNAMSKDHPARDYVRALLLGQSLAPKGLRHDAINQITWWIAEKQRIMDVGALGDLFMPSLLAMQADTPANAATPEEVIRAYQGALTKIATSQREERKADADEQRRLAMEDQQSKVGGEYTPQELEAIAAHHGWRATDLHDKWIIQREGSWWILGPSGRYSPVALGKDDVFIEMKRQLARAPVRLVDATRNGFTYRTVANVTVESGQVAERIISDLILQETVFNAETRTLHEAITPRRLLEPAYDEDIDQWLRLIAGPQYSKVVDWLSCVPDLSKLLCGLYIDGVKGAGKTLLATGPARIWTEGPPVDLGDILRGFNEELVRCPVVLADEEIEKPYRYANVTPKLRSMLGTFQRTVKRKYRAPAPLRGCIRLVLAANNDRLLDHDVSTANDVQAVAQRFLYIDAPQTAADFLEAIPKAVRDDWSNFKIAQHTLFLHKHHTVENPGKRFWVEGDISRMTRQMTYRSKWNAAVCEWLVRYLMNPTSADNLLADLIKRGNGELLVNDQALIDGWDLYTKNQRYDPETNKIGAALAALSSTKKKRHLRTSSGKRIRYRVIDVKHLTAWSEDSNIGDPEEILKAVGAHLQQHESPEHTAEELELAIGVTNDLPF